MRVTEALVAQGALVLVGRGYTVTDGGRERFAALGVDVARRTRRLRAQSTSRSGITRQRYSAGSLHPSGSSVAARSGALKVSLTSSVGM